MASRKEKQVVIYTRIDVPDAAKLSKLAKNQQRSVAAQAAVLIKEGLRQSLIPKPGN